MREGAVVLLSLAQADGRIKTRPALALREMPGFGDWLVCGISTQLQQRVPGFDEVVAVEDLDFSSSRLVQTSLIRLGFLQVVPIQNIMGRIGSISVERHHRLLTNLSQHLRP